MPRRRELLFREKRGHDEIGGADVGTLAGCCFQVASSLAANIAAKVAESLAASSLMQMPGEEADSAALLAESRSCSDHPWMCPSMLPCSEQDCQSQRVTLSCRLPNLTFFSSLVEAQAGHYPVTWAVLQLTRVLLLSGVRHPLLQVRSSFCPPNSSEVLNKVTFR